MAKNSVAEELFAEVGDTEPEAARFYEPLVHTMVRAIATTAVPIGDASTIEEVDADVSAWIAKGFRLVDTHVLGVDPNSINMLYVLSK